MAWASKVDFLGKPKEIAVSKSIYMPKILLFIGIFVMSHHLLPNEICYRRR